MKTAFGKTEDLYFHSQFLQEIVPLMVYLPASFSPFLSYSLLIAQDGKDYFTLGRIRRLLERLEEEALISNTIFVGIPYMSIKDRRDKYHPNGAKHQAYIRFLAHELIPYIEKHYPTEPIAGARILLGDSLAATVSLLSCIAYPHTFGKAILQSPFVNEAVFSCVQSFQHPALLELYHVIGQQETHVRMTDGTLADFLTPNRKLHRMMKERQFRMFYDEFAGDRSWKYWQPDLERALCKMLAP